MKTKIIAIFIEDPRKRFLFCGQALQAQIGNAVADDSTWNECTFGSFGALRILNDGVGVQRSLGMRTILLSRTAIYEQVLLSRVSMYIHEQFNFSALQRFFDHVFESIDFWRGFHGGVEPLPVEVVSSKTASVVAGDDTIWVQHRDNLKHVLISQSASIWVLAHQEIDDAFHDE